MSLGTVPVPVPQGAGNNFKRFYDSHFHCSVDHDIVPPSDRWRFKELVYRFQWNESQWLISVPRRSWRGFTWHKNTQCECKQASLYPWVDMSEIPSFQMGLGFVNTRTHHMIWLFFSPPPTFNRLSSLSSCDRYGSRSGLECHWCSGLSQLRGHWRPDTSAQLEEGTLLRHTQSLHHVRQGFQKTTNQK